MQSTCTWHRNCPVVVNFPKNTWNITKAWNSLPTDLKTASCSMDAFKRRLKTWLFNQKGLWLTFRLLLLQLFYQCSYYYIIIISLSSSLSLSLSSFYNHHLTLCAIGLYMHCRRRNTNDCLQLQLHFISSDYRSLVLVTNVMTYSGPCSGSVT